MIKKMSIIFIGCSFVFGCATHRVAELESSDPDRATEEVRNLKHDLIESNGDLLANEDFERGTWRLDDAEEARRNNESTEEVLNLLGQAKAHYQKAEKIADSRTHLPEIVLQARQGAVQAKAHEKASLKKNIHNVDESLRDDTDLFTVDLAPSDISKYQNKYMELEVKAVQSTQLATFRSIIQKAERNDASDLAPKTFGDATSQLMNAENTIQQSPRNPSLYKASVEKANKAAKLLDDVMDKLLGEARGSSESVALQLVYQERKVGRLSDKVGRLEGSLAESSKEVGNVSRDLERKSEQFQTAEKKLETQKALDEVRGNFNEDEATVYQQGEKLIIRLKKINFKSGSASIPTSSMPLLSRVSNVVSGLDPNEIVVEGHTDSTGADGRNMILSNERAEAVKTYLVSQGVKYSVNARGYGETQPIANNQTKQGRLLNRRVDIIVNAN